MINEEIIIGRKFSSIVRKELCRPGVIDDGENPVPVTTMRRIASDNLFETINKNMESEIIPQNCRIIKHDENTSLYVIEEKPQIRTISSTIQINETVEELKISGMLKEFGLDEDELLDMPQPYHYKLSFPYIIYFIRMEKGTYHSMSIYYKLSPITSYSDNLLLTNLPNVSHENYVCIGGDMTNLSIEGIIQSWWEYSFNSDYIVCISRYKNIHQIKSFIHWAYYTSIDPLFIFNIPWLNNPVNLSNVINKNLFSSAEKSHITFNKLKSYFSSEIIDSKTRYFKSNAISMNISNTDLISIGDEFLLHGRIQYITEFFTNNNYEIKIVKFEDDSGKKSQYDFTIEFKQELLNLIKNKIKLKSLSATINGIELNKGDMVRLYYPTNTIYIIKNIFKPKYGPIEFTFQSGNLNYILDNLKFDKIEIDKIKFNDEILVKGQEYHLYSKCFPFNYIMNFKFDKIILKYNKMLFSFFENKLGLEKTTTLDPIHWNIIDISTLNIRKILRIGNILIYNNNSYFISQDKNNLFKNDYMKESYINDNSSINKLLCEIFISDDEIFIPGHGIDQNLKVGDNVVIADWDNPNSMIIPRVITGIIRNDLKVFVNTIDKEGNVLFTQIINKNIFNIGIVRKIEFSYKNLKSGDRIRASKTKILNFPKKSFNTIIGFLHEGLKKPMVLCSNLCTLWYSDIINNFEIWDTTEKLNKISKKKDDEIDVNKIKNNIGDIVNTNNGSVGIIIIPNRNIKWTGNFCKISILNNYLNDLRNLSEYKSKYGFLTPRLSMKDQLDLPILSNFHQNMLGGFFKIDNDNPCLIVDKESLNV